MAQPLFLPYGSSRRRMDGRTPTVRTAHPRTVVVWTLVALVGASGWKPGLVITSGIACGL
ncbi:hypothetical protein [Streptomyces bluensis]|uniref:Uncharacterized protein n=1 Tax=Streptomyces bluensis TaxID=33897 RepID=A0ABW6URZ4_9ACTN